MEFNLLRSCFVVATVKLSGECVQQRHPEFFGIWAARSFWVGAVGVVEALHSAMAPMDSMGIERVPWCPAGSLRFKKKSDTDSACAPMTH